MTDTVAALRAALDKLTVLRNRAGIKVPVIVDDDGALRADPRAGTAGRLVVAPGQTIASLWGNTTHDQTVICFANTGDRDNQWPAPHDGSVCFTADSSTLWQRRAGVWVALALPGVQIVKSVFGGAIVGAVWDGVSPIIRYDGTHVVTATAANWTLAYATPFPRGVFNCMVSMGDNTLATQVTIKASGHSLAGCAGQVWNKDGTTPPNGNVRINVSAVGW